jgi:cellulose synthase/poly-beta-1,6-N-acetylglucosamine synthase-like glycosyltransferase
VALPLKLVKLARGVQFGFQLLAGIGGIYFLLLTAATFLKSHSACRSTRSRPRFAVIVPAHDEEHTIPDTLTSLERMDYPPECFGVFVVADNCQDATAEVARRHRCTVWERVEPERRAKGYALNWAFERVPEQYDAVVIVDADTNAAPTLLTNFARAYEPLSALQASLLQAASSNVSSVASYVASAVQNCLKPLGRQNLGFSAGLGGTGICIPRDLLEEVPWRRSGLAEDVEYHVDLVLAGRRVRFVPEARVEATAPHTLGGLRSQRLRWERGRIEAIERFTGPLLARALRKREAAAFEVFVSMVAPPLSLTASTSVGCIALGVLRRSATSLVVGTLGLLAIACAAFRALWIVRAPARIYAYSLFFPMFVAWRTYLSVRSLLQGARKSWVRTERSGERL